MTHRQRILIIRPSALGDVCRSVPLAAAIRRHRPEAEIHWLVNAPFAEVLEAHPAIDRVLPFDRRALGRHTRRMHLAPALGFMRSLREQSYDAVIDAQGLARSGLFAFATRAPLRIGHADARELGWLGCNHRVRAGRDLHTVDRMMSLLRPLGIYEPEPDMRLYPRPQDRRWRDADAELSAPYIVLAPTSVWPGKRWPIDRFTDLARRLCAEGHRIVVVGAPGEEPQCSPLLDLARQGLPVVNRVGQTTIGQMLAVIEHARLVVANDSAALHMAVGLCRPVVALFGPTRTDRVGPYRKQEAVIQHVTPQDRLDHKDAASAGPLMARISTDEVQGRAEALLDESPGVSPRVQVT